MGKDQGRRGEGVKRGIVRCQTSIGHTYSHMKSAIMNHSYLKSIVRSGSRVIVAALVPAKKMMRTAFSSKH
jgi:hypothetical protein